eukprot:8778550-Ditylum_brightwellii.AAC.1
MQHCQHGLKSSQDICLLMNAGPIWVVGDTDKPLFKSEVLELLLWRVVPLVDSIFEGKHPEFHIYDIWPSNMCI